MVETTIKNLNSIEQNTSKKKIREKNLEIIEATKEKVQTKVEDIINDLKEALMVIIANEKERDSGEVNEMKKVIDEAIRKVRSKNKKFSQALNKLCQENRKNNIQKKTLDKVKTEGDELLNKYNSAKMLHEKHSIKKNEEVSKNSTGDAKENIGNVSLDKVEDTVDVVEDVLVETTEAEIDGDDKGFTSKDQGTAEAVIIGNPISEKSGNALKNADIQTETLNNNKEKVVNESKNFIEDKKKIGEIIEKLRPKLEKLRDKRSSLNMATGDIDSIWADMQKKFLNAKSGEELETLKAEVADKYSMVNNKIAIGSQVSMIRQKIKQGKLTKNAKCETILSNAKQFERNSFAVTGSKEIKKALEEIKNLNEKLDLRIQEIKIDKQKIQGLIEKALAEIKKIKNKELANAKRAELKSIVEVIVVSPEDKAKKDLAIEEFIKETMAINNTKKEIPAKNEILKEILNSVNSMRAVYGKKGPSYLKDFLDKDLNKNDLEKLAEKQKKLFDKLEYIKLDEDKKTNDKNLKKFKSRIKNLESSGFVAEAEAYKEELIELFKYSLTKINEIKALHEKGESSVKDESKIVVGVKDSEEGEPTIEISDKGQELSEEDNKKLEATEPVVEDVVNAEEVEESMVGNNDNGEQTNNSKKEKNKEKVEDDLILQDEIGTVPGSLNSNEVEKPVSVETVVEENTLEYSEEDIKEKINSVNTINDLTKVVTNIVKENGKIDMGKNHEWNSHEQVSDNIDNICKNNEKGKYLKRKMEGACGKCLVEKIEDILKDSNSSEDVVETTKVDSETEIVATETEVEAGFKVEVKDGEDETEVDAMEEAGAQIPKVKREFSDEEVDKLMDAANEIAGKIKEAIKKIDDKKFKQQIIEEKVAMYGDINDSENYEEILEKYQNFLDRINTHFKDLEKQRLTGKQKQKLESIKDLLKDEEAEDTVVKEEGSKGLEAEAITLPEFKAETVKIGEALQQTIKEEMIKNGISDDKVGEVVAKIGTVIDTVIDRETEKDFSQLKHHKGKIITGVAVALAATATTTVMRALGGSTIKAGAKTALGVLTLGAGSGYLRAKIRGYLNPIADKLRASDDKKFKERRDYHGKAITSDEDTVRMAIKAVIKSEKNSGKLEKGNLEEIKTKLQEHDEYKDLSKEQQEEIAKSMFCLNNIANNNNNKLAEFLEREHKNVWDKVKGKWARMSPEVRGAALGAAFGSISAASKVIFENSAIVGGAISGIVSGTMLGGSLKNYFEKKNIDKKSLEMMEEIDKFESGEVAVSIGKLRVYLESGALEKYPLAQEKAKALLATKLVEGDITTEIDDNFSEDTEKKELVEKFSLSNAKKKLAYVTGISLGVAMGSGTAWAMNNYAQGGVIKEKVDSVKGWFEKDYSSQEVKETFGINTNALKGFDSNGDGEYGMKEVAAAQSSALGLDTANSLAKPISREEYLSLMDVKDFVSPEAIHKVLADNQVTGSELASLNDAKNQEVTRRIKIKNIEIARQNNKLEVDEGIVQQEKAVVLTNKLNTQKEALGGLDAGKLLDEKQIAVINKYRDVLGNNKLQDIVRDGLDKNEIVNLNKGIITTYSEKNGVSLNMEDVGKAIDGRTDPSDMLDGMVKNEQSKVLGIDIAKPLKAENFRTLGAYTNRGGVVKEALANHVYDRSGLEQIALKEKTGINLNVAKNKIFIKEFKNIVDGSMSEPKYAKIEAGGSISEALKEPMTADSKVVLINADGHRIDNFDANLVHEGDVVVEKNGEIYVMKTSGIQMNKDDSLQDIYNKIDGQLDAEKIPKDIQNYFGRQDGNGEFTSQINKSEAGNIRKFWGSLNKEQQEQWQNHQLGQDHRKAILGKGKWVESWSTVRDGETVEKTFTTASPEGGYKTNFNLSVSDNIGNDGVPDVIHAEAGHGIHTHDYVYTREANESGDAFSSRVAKALNTIGVEKSNELVTILKSNENISIDDIKTSGLSQFDSQFEEKVKFWNDHNSGILDTSEKAKDFFNILDNNGITASKENMRFVLNGEVNKLNDRVIAVSFADKAKFHIDYEDALKYKDKLPVFESPKKMSAGLALIKGEKVEASLKTIFDTGNDAKYSENTTTGVCKLEDVKLGKHGEKVDILFTRDADGNMKFGYDGDALLNEGTKGNWNSIRPNTDLNEHNIKELKENLRGRFEKIRINQEALDNQGGSK